MVVRDVDSELLPGEIDDEAWAECRKQRVEAAVLDLLSPLRRGRRELALETFPLFGEGLGPIVLEEAQEALAQLGRVVEEKQGERAVASVDLDPPADVLANCFAA
jgi:hypothetical protein